jgi:2-methylcitrate dehydratase PrpD
MTIDTGRAALPRLSTFATDAAPPPLARTRAAAAILDTVGVTLAGASEPAGRIVQETIAPDGGDTCTVIGGSARASATNAALANGTAAHALDYDDMCFVSLAHPSAPLVSAVLAAGELTAASGARLVDAYVVGFEIEARLGKLMNPTHYQRGWHCTSTLGVIGAAAGVSRVLGLDAATTARAIAIAASAASGLKENFGTMVKPLHAGLAARDAVLAALLARGGMTASALALEGPQGFLRAMDSAGTDLEHESADLGSRWEIVDTGITVKLYPSCAATHPPLDAILTLRHREGFTADEVERVEVDVDRITPTVLIYDRPASGLEAKFSLPFCAAAAVVDGRVGIDTFEASRISDARVATLMSRVTMTVDPALGVDMPALTQARVRIQLRDGRTLSQAADGARGYPENPASDDELAGKFLSCAARSIDWAAAEKALSLVRDLEHLTDVRELMRALAKPARPWRRAWCYSLVPELVFFVPFVFKLFLPDAGTCPRFQMRNVRVNSITGVPF